MSQPKPGSASGRAGVAPILFLDASPAVGGATRVLTCVLDHLSERARSVVVFGSASGIGALVGPRADVLAPMELPLLTFAAGAGGPVSLIAGYARACGAILRLIREHRPALLWANGFMGALQSAVPAHLGGVPMIWHAHELLPLAARNRPFVRMVASSATAIVCVSESTRRRLVEFGVSERKCHVVYNTAPSTREAGGGAPPAGRSILAAGALTPQKGHDVLVDAMREVVRRVPGATLDIAGEPLFPADAPFAARLRAAVQEAGLERSVRFLGHVRDVEQRIDAAEIIVHPSRDEETFGLVPLEAMTRGKPVVASRTGGLPEVVEDGRTGVLVPPGDAQALARAIVDLLGDAALRERFGREGRRVARERFGPGRFVEGLNRVTKEVVGDELFSEGARGADATSNRASSSS